MENKVEEDRGKKELLLYSSASVERASPPPPPPPPPLLSRVFVRPLRRSWNDVWGMERGGEGERRVP